jgi:hypothetical protein
VTVNVAVTMPAAFIVAVVEAEFALAIVMLAVLAVHVENAYPTTAVAPIETVAPALNQLLAGLAVPSPDGLAAKVTKN